MGKIAFEKKVEELIQYINIEHRLPKVWEEHFSDNSDMRLWFNKLYNNDLYKEYIYKINNLLYKYNYKILSDEEKEKEFLDYIKKYDEVPEYSSAYFSDNSDMENWYINYKRDHNDFEEEVHNSLREYKEFDLSYVWFYAKEEFYAVVDKLKRIPKHGEVYTQNGIDIRVIFDKLCDSEPDIAENLLIELSSYSKDKIDNNEKKKQFLEYVRNIGYTPWLQECRFSDGVDMYTWYQKYKYRIDGLEEEVKKIMNENNKSKINLYLLYDEINDGNIFYTLCANEGEINLDSLTTYEEAKKIYPNLSKRGQFILKENEEIQNIKIKKKK